MTTMVQLRRAGSSANDQYIGAVGEITVDIDNWALRLHDGATPGGHIIGSGPLGNGVILPSQTGQSGKFLTTNGSNLSWAAIPGGSSGDYVLPIASDTTIGGIRIGSGLTIDPKTGVVSVLSQQGPVGPTGPIGLTGPTGPQGATGAPGTMLPPYVLPIASATVLGGVKIGSGVNVLADGTISVFGTGTSTIVTKLEVDPGGKPYTIKVTNSDGTNYLVTMRTTQGPATPPPPSPVTPPPAPPTTPPPPAPPGTPPPPKPPVTPPPPAPPGTPPPPAPPGTPPPPKPPTTPPPPGPITPPPPKPVTPPPPAKPGTPPPPPPKPVTPPPPPKPGTPPPPKPPAVPPPPKSPPPPKLPPPPPPPKVKPTIMINYTGTGEQGTDGTVTWSTQNAPATAKVNVTNYLIGVGNDGTISISAQDQSGELTGTWNEDPQYKGKTVNLIAELYDTTSGTVLAKATKPIKLVGKGDPAIDITVTGSGEAGTQAKIEWTTDNAPSDGTLTFQTYFKADKDAGYTKNILDHTILASGFIEDVWTDDAALAGTTQTITAQLKDGTGKVVADTSDTIKLSGKADIKVETSSATYQATKDGAVNWTSTGAPDGAYVDIDNTYIDGYSVPTEGQLPTDSAVGTWVNEPGAHTITVTLKNADGNQLATANTSITIEAAPEPQIELNVTSDTFMAEEDGTISWTITDAPPESTLHVTTFFIEGDYDGAAETGSTSGKWRVDAVGDQTVEAVISDKDGNVLKSATSPITIVAQPAPEITLEATSDSFTVGTPGTISWTIVNPPKAGGTIHVVTHLDSGDYDGAAEDGNTTGNWNDEPGEQTITATISVDGTEVATKDTTVTIVAAPTPTIEITVDAASYYPGDDATINWTIADAPEGAHLNVTTFLDSGDYDNDATNGSGSTQGKWKDEVGAHTITGTITKNGAELATGTAEITIEEPPAPEFSLSVEAGSGLEGSSGTISWTINWANENQAAGATIDIPETYLDSGAYNGEAQSGSTSGSWNSDAGQHTITATITTAGGKTFTASGSVEIFLRPTISVDVDTGGGEVGNSGTVSWTIDNPPNGASLHVTVGSLDCGDYDGPAESGSTGGSWGSAGTFDITASFSAYGEPFSASTSATINEPPPPPPEPPPPPPPPVEE